MNKQDCLLFYYIADINPFLKTQAPLLMSTCWGLIGWSDVKNLDLTVVEAPHC